ncbi:GerMN domain-containing protein [bacterium]|nr:GerMN domain-containing protein [bacterium]
MNFAQKVGIFCLVVIATVYLYFSFFSSGGFNSNKLPSDIPADVIDENKPVSEKQDETKTYEVKTIKIFITDSNGNLRSVNRKCDTSKEKSCFEFAIKELISAPTKWEKSKGLSSEIPSGTKVLSVREGSNNVLIDLSSAFESGGGAESTYIRVSQLIKTAKANTNVPVYLYINGKQADVIGGEGIMIKQPLNERSLDE